jgi:hypothetical protein
MFSAYFGHQHLIQSSADRMLSFPYGDIQLPPVALFQLDQDPHELKNLVANAPHAADALLAKLRAQVDRFEAMEEGGEATQVGQQALSSLREAGYLQDAAKSSAKPDGGRRP